MLLIASCFFLNTDKADMTAIVHTPNLNCTGIFFTTTTTVTVCTFLFLACLSISPPLAAIPVLKRSSEH